MEYRREIDGLRALAVLPVILFHGGFQAFSGGFVGVDVFFVISGYLITSIILSELDQGKFSIITFYERRARRILPALFLVMFVCLPFAWLWLLPNEMRRFSVSLVSVSTFSSNILFYLTSGYFGISGELKPLLHTWSLAVEEQFYVVFPLLLLLTWRMGRRIILTILVTFTLLSLASAQWLSYYNPQFAFLLLPTRFWELLLGSFVAFYFSSVGNIKHNKALSEICSITGFCLILYAIFTYSSKTPFPGLYTLVPTVGAVLIVLFATPSTSVGKLLGTKVFVGVGLISYSAYLWHQPLFAFARHRLIGEPSQALFAVLALAAILLAYLSWRHVEVPFRDKKRFSRRSIFWASGLCSLFFFGFGVAGHYKEGFEARMPKEVLDAHVTRRHEQLLQSSGCELSSGGFVFSSCVKGNVSQKPSIAIVGDSHAQSLVHELSNVLKEQGLSFVPLVKSGCSLDFYMPADSENSELRACSSYQSNILKELERSDIGTYIVFTWRDDPSVSEPSDSEKRSFQSHLKSIDRIIQAGKRVIVVYPIPTYDVYISDYIAKNLLFNGDNFEKISTDSEVFKSRIRYFFDGYDSLQPHKNLSRIRTTSLFCDSYEKGKCVTQVKGVPLYYDDDHLSNEGAKLVVGEIIKLIVED
jgi:peptidoglycan/LPS O-acetylase OafA/YrhL